MRLVILTTAILLIGAAMAQAQNKPFGDFKDTRTCTTVCNGNICTTTCY